MNQTSSLFRKLPVVPYLDDWDAFDDRWQTMDQFCEVLKEDFFEARKLCEASPSPFTRRMVVRTFGSAVDGIAACMREMAVGACKLWGRPLNPFLTEKAKERESSAYYKITTSYRLIAEFVPSCPLAKVPGSRWSRLQRALTLRNKVVHPATVKDLEVPVGAGEDAFADLIASLTDLIHDFEAFWVWYIQEMERMIRKVGGRSQRLLPKVGRNNPCPCKRGRKFKDCCGKPISAPREE